MRFVSVITTLTAFLMSQVLTGGVNRPDGGSVAGEGPDGVPMTFFQLNIWEGLRNIDNGQQVFNDQLLALMPDVASFCEFPCQGSEDKEEVSAEYILRQAIDYIYEKTGVRYYKTSLSGSGTRGVLTRFPIVEEAAAVKSASGDGVQQWFYRTVIDFHGREIAVYSSHSVHYYYACYLPRGYGDGAAPYGWDKLEGGPVSDLSVIVERDVKGDRERMAVDLCADVKEQTAKGRSCVYAGDLNQPSHLDWTEETRNMRGHNGLVVPWSVSKSLLANGFLDAYRVIYPDPVTNPGFTWPVSNKDARKSTSWAPEADERDRIDFVYYFDDGFIRATDARLVGPRETIDHEKPALDSLSEGEIILPANGIWCSDHRGLLVTFIVNTSSR